MRRLVRRAVPHRPGLAWTPLGDAGTNMTLSMLLAAVPDYAVDDLHAQISLADEALSQIRAASTCDTVALGPTFAASPDAHGTDADLVVGGLLIDVIATVKPER